MFSFDETVELDLTCPRQELRCIHLRYFCVVLKGVTPSSILIRHSNSTILMQRSLSCFMNLRLARLRNNSSSIRWWVSPLFSFSIETQALRLQTYSISSNTEEIRQHSETTRTVIPLVPFDLGPSAIPCTHAAVDANTPLWNGKVLLRVSAVNYIALSCTDMVSPANRPIDKFRKVRLSRCTMIKLEALYSAYCDSIVYQDRSRTSITPYYPFSCNAWSAFKPSDRTPNSSSNIPLHHYKVAWKVVLMKHLLPINVSRSHKPNSYADSLLVVLSFP